MPPLGDDPRPRRRGRPAGHPIAELEVGRPHRDIDDLGTLAPGELPDAVNRVRITRHGRSSPGASYNTELGRVEGLEGYHDMRRKVERYGLTRAIDPGRPTCTGLVLSVVPLVAGARDLVPGVDSPTGGDEPVRPDGKADTVTGDPRNGRS